MPQIQIEIIRKDADAEELLPPKLSFHKLSMKEFAAVIIDRTVSITESYPELPVEYVTDIILKGIKDELRLTPNIEVIIDI